MIGSQEMVKPPKSSQDLSSKTTEQKPAFQCSFPYKQLVITAEGNVLPCCTFYGEEMVLGNILTAYQNNQAISLQSFWESSKMQHLREIHKNKQYASNPICKKCIDGAINA